MLEATLSRLWICWYAPDAHLNGSAGEHGLTFFFCQSVPIGVFGEAVHGIVRLLLSMRDCGRRMTFIGLTNTLLNDSQARLIAGALRRLTATLAPDEEPETLEMLQMVFQAETRTELLAAAQRAGVNLLLSDPNGLGPALRGF